MPISGIIRLATFLVERSDKGSEDTAALLTHLADLSAEIVSKWELNFREIKKLRFNNDRIRKERKNADFLDQLSYRGTSFNELAHMSRENFAPAMEISEILKRFPDGFRIPSDRSAKRTPRKQISKDNKVAKGRDGQKEGAFDEIRRSVSSLLSTRNKLKKRFDELFDDLNVEHGSALSERIAEMDIAEIEKNIQRLYTQSSKIKAISKSYRAQIR